MEYTNEQLAAMVKAGDQEAAALLWEQVRRLILKLMSKYYPLCHQNGIEAEDLDQSGYLALIRAVEAYTPDKKLLFTSYLTHHVGNVAREALGLRGHQGRPRQTVSLDEELPGTDAFTLADTIEDPDAALAFEYVQEE